MLLHDHSRAGSCPPSPHPFLLALSYQLHAAEIFLYETKWRSNLLLYTPLSLHITKSFGAELKIDSGFLAHKYHPSNQQNW